MEGIANKDLPTDLSTGGRNCSIGNRFGNRVQRQCVLMTVGLNDIC